MKVVVQYEDQPVHCVDISDGLGKRQLRIRPKDSGVLITGKDLETVWLDHEETLELIGALERITR